MPVISLTGFLGENRRLHPTLVPPAQGVTSLNQKPGRGDLRPWKTPSTVATVPSGRQTIYRMGRDVASDTQFWLSWASAVHAVTGLVADDTTERTYYTGDGTPKVTNTVLGLAAPPYPTASRPLGLPRPAAAPTVAVIPGGSSTVTQSTYFYVYTYVNDWGWESAPSPVSAAVTRGDDVGTTISGFSTVPAGNYNVAAIRIYRTQTGASGATQFFFLRELVYGSTTTTDDNRELQNQLETINWDAAPDDLTYLTAMWNGMLAGISNGAVRFCETNVPYAWPPTYEVLPPDSKPVALGVFGQSLLVLTNNRPLIVAGSSPDSMDHMPMPTSQACVAPRSVVSMGGGVAWASEDGLCWFGDGGAKVLTAGAMTREDWQALVPSTIIGQHYEGLYFGSYDPGGGRKGFIVNPTLDDGIFFLDTGYPAMHFDELRDQLYVLSGTNVQKWDAGTAMTYRFRSKRFMMPYPLNFSCAQVLADTYPVTVRVYADDWVTPKHTEIVASRRGFRLPSGFAADAWQVEIEGTGAVQAVHLATSMQELQAV